MEALLNLNFNTNLVPAYHSNSQKIRIMSESWVVDNFYCVRCGCHLKHFDNNNPVGDMYCAICKEEFELKSSHSTLKNKIVDGSYSAMIEKIDNGTIPNFLYLNYSSEEYIVRNFIVIPKHYITKEIIIKRKPLAQTARRAGWVGCTIDVSDIPDSGKLYIIRNGIEENKYNIIDKFNKMLFLRNTSIESKGWLLDILKCIELLNKKEFNLFELYSFENYLKIKHPNNNNIQAKIRQQLQYLRDYGYLSFIKRGLYKIMTS